MLRSALKDEEQQISISHSPQTPDDQMITTTDRKYLQHIDQQLQLSESLPFDIVSILQIRGIHGHVLGNPITMTMAIPWPEFPLSSKAFRYAVLTFASSQLEGDQNNTNTLEYLEKFYKYVNEAIEASSFTEIVVACYTILLYSYMSHESFETSLIHFKGLSKVYSNLREVQSASAIRRLTQLDVLWRGGLQAILRKFWNRPQSKHLPPGEHSLLVDLFKVLRCTSYSLFPDSGVHDLSINSSYTRVETLGCYLSIYWDYYLALHMLPSHERDAKLFHCVRNSIYETLHQIIDLIPRLLNARELLCQAREDVRSWRPDSTILPTDYLDHSSIQFPHQFTFEDERAALLYAYAKLIHIFVSMPNGNSNRMIPSALLLCRLCASALTGHLPFKSPFGLQMTRYLFTVGLVLTKSVYPAGENPR